MSFHIPESMVVEWYRVLDDVSFAEGMDAAKIYKQIGYSTGMPQEKEFLAVLNELRRLRKLGHISRKKISDDKVIAATKIGSDPLDGSGILVLVQ